jgi:hypothetical protein
VEWQDYQKSKRNNHLFLKDYSSEDYSTFMFDVPTHIPSLSVLNE